MYLRPRRVVPVLDSLSNAMIAELTLPFALSMFCPTNGVHRAQSRKRATSEELSPALSLRAELSRLALPTPCRLTCPEEQSLIRGCDDCRRSHTKLDANRAFRTNKSARCTGRWRNGLSGREWSQMSSSDSSGPQGSNHAVARLQSSYFGWCFKANECLVERPRQALGGWPSDGN